MAVFTRASKNVESSMDTGGIFKKMGVTTKDIGKMEKRVGQVSPYSKTAQPTRANSFPTKNMDRAKKSMMRRSSKESGKKASEPDNLSKIHHFEYKN